MASSAPLKLKMTALVTGGDCDSTRSSSSSTATPDALSPAPGLLRFESKCALSCSGMGDVQARRTPLQTSSALSRDAALPVADCRKLNAVQCGGMGRTTRTTTLTT